MSAQDDIYRNVVRRGLSLKNSGSINPKKRKHPKVEKRISQSTSSQAAKQSVSSPVLGPEDDEEIADEKQRIGDKAHHISEDEDINDAEDEENALIAKVLKLEGMTSAEKTFYLARLKRQRERVEKRTALTHRERMARLNEHLSKLSEHFDIPKVGPG